MKKIKYVYFLKGSVTNENKKALRKDKNCIIRVLPNKEFQVFELYDTEFEMEIKENYSFIKDLDEDTVKNILLSEEEMIEHCIEILKYTPYLEIDKFKIVKSKL